MQRDSFNQNPLSVISVFLLALIYEPITGIFIFLSPLFGVVLMLLIDDMKRNDRLLQIMALMVYIAFFELDRGFILFSFIVFFTIFYLSIVSYVKHIIECQWCHTSIFVTLGYIGYYMFNTLIATLLNIDSPALSPILIWYILIDIILHNMIKDYYAR